MAGDRFFSNDRAMRQQYESLQYRQDWNNAMVPNLPAITNMKQPKFQIGDAVKLRGGDRTWVVGHIKTQMANGQYVYVIFSPETGGNRRELESDLVTAPVDMREEAKPRALPKPQPKVSFDSVIIEPEKRQQILEALEQINQSELIFETWGFGETIEKGKGVSMLFYGLPGTGKTLMAQAIAHKLDYELKIISTADVESSAPGEAERNIRKHFKDAQDNKKGAILLFDECDSLIYTRSNVGPIMSAQINELLSQIEKFNGITLFTTNRLGTLDEALNRRLALKLEFSMPTLEQRAEIWQRMFPKKCPLDKDIDWHRLAIVEVSGGYIKNTVLRAARMAACEKIPDKKKKIHMKHLVKALSLETESMIEFENARKKHDNGVPVSGGMHQAAGKVRING